MYQIVMLYTLRLHNVICHLYLSKTGDKNRQLTLPYLKIYYKSTVIKKDVTDIKIEK